MPAELHCHIDGLLDAAMLDELAAGGHPLGVTSAALAARCPVTSMTAWLHDYIAFLAPHTEPRDVVYPLIAERHVRRLVAQRVDYAELFVSGLLFACPQTEAVIELFRELRARVQAAAGASLRVELVACVGRGPADKLARQLPRILALREAGLVCGVALAGDERFPVAPLRAFFDRVRATGMGIEIHAGEHGGPESVRDALEHGMPDRLGHGLAVFEDPALVELVATRGIHLELCPTSNLRLGAVRDVSELPVRRALELGLPFSINTDDPGPFGCSLTSELELARDTFGLGDTELARIHAWTLAAAFAGR